MAEKSNFYKIIISTVSRLSSHILSIVITFFLTPLMIKTLGSYMYGIWVLANIFAGYYTYSDLGITSAVERNLAVASGDGDKKQFTKILVNGVFLNLITAFVILFISLSTYLIMNYIQFKDYKLISTVVFLIGFNFALCTPFRSFYAIVFANIRFELISAINIAQTIANFILTAYLLLHGYGIIALALLNMFISIIANFTCLYFASRLYNFNDFDFRLVKKDTILSLFNYSSKTVVIQIADILKGKLDEIVTASFISISMVTTYSIGSKLNSYSFSFLYTITSVLQPLFSKNINIKTDEEKAELFYFTSKAMIVMSCLILFGFLFLGRQFIILWMGPSFHGAYWVLVILGTYYFVSAIQGSASTYLYSSNKHHYLAVMSIIEGVFNLIFSLLFVIYFKMGIVGVALGSLVPAIFTKLIYQPKLICKILKLKTTDYYLFMVKNILIGAIVYISAGLFVLQFKMDNYLKFFAFIFIFLAMFIVHILLITTKEEKANLLTKIRGELKTNQPEETYNY